MKSDLRKQNPPFGRSGKTSVLPYAPSCLVLYFFLSFSEFYYSIKTRPEVKEFLLGYREWVVCYRKGSKNTLLRVFLLPNELIIVPPLRLASLRAVLSYACWLRISSKPSFLSPALKTCSSFSQEHLLLRPCHPDRMTVR